MRGHVEAMSSVTNHRGFRRVTPGRFASCGQTIARTEDLPGRLEHLVSERFLGITGLQVTVVAMPHEEVDAAEAFARQMHPLCTHCSSEEKCEDRWRRHVTALRRRPEAHWHRCDKGNLCGVVPVVVSGRALAACKLVCDGDLQEEAFQEHVDLLEILVDRFIEQHAESLERLAGCGPDGNVIGDIDPIIARFERYKHEWHSQVQRAINLVDTDGRDPHLSVAYLAERLGMNSTYLGNLFSRQTGLTLTRYISIRRIHLAKQLLAETDWQVKRVAHESGHGNADWFSNVFRAATGLTPSEYRRKSRIRRRSS